MALDKLNEYINNMISDVSVEIDDLGILRSLSKSSIIQKDPNTTIVLIYNQIKMAQHKTNEAFDNVTKYIEAATGFDKLPEQEEEPETPEVDESEFVDTEYVKTHKKPEIKKELEPEVIEEKPTDDDIDDEDEEEITTESIRDKIAKL